MTMDELIKKTKELNEQLAALRGACSDVCDMMSLMQQSLVRIIEGKALHGNPAKDAATTLHSCANLARMIHHDMDQKPYFPKLGDKSK